MWFSNGGTKGSFHLDSIENIICLLRGNKTFTMIAYDKYKHKVRGCLGGSVCVWTFLQFCDSREWRNLDFGNDNITT